MAYFQFVDDVEEYFTKRDDCITVTGFNREQHWVIPHPKNVKIYDIIRQLWIQEYFIGLPKAFYIPKDQYENEKNWSDKSLLHEKLLYIEM
jgi:hypothetical protein